MADVTIEEISRARSLVPVADSVRALVEFLGSELLRLENLAAVLADEPDELGDRYRAIEHVTALGELRDAIHQVHAAAATAEAAACH